MMIIRTKIWTMIHTICLPRESVAFVGNVPTFHQEFKALASGGQLCQKASSWSPCERLQHGRYDKVKHNACITPVYTTCLQLLHCVLTSTERCAVQKNNDVIAETIRTALTNLIFKIFIISLWYDV
jgi:hypothetical protein